MPAIIELNTASGPLLIPDTEEAIAVAREVIDQDCYQFRVLQQSGFAPRLVWDVGASWGVASVLASQLWPDCTIWAFEPVKQRFDFAVHNLRTRPNVHLFRRALIGYWGHDQAAAARGIATDSAVRPQAVEFLKRLADSEPNPQSLAEFLQEFPVPGPIDLLKIDIEGAEIGVLAELRELGQVQPMTHIRGEWHFNALTDLPPILEPTHRVQMNRPEGARWHYFQASRRD